MKMLLLNCRNFKTTVGALATRPIGICPEPLSAKVYFTKKAIVSLLTVEDGDNTRALIPNIAAEIASFCKDTGNTSVVIFPFAHLSNKLASSKETRATFDLLECELQNLNVTRVHFGSHKSLLLDVYGHRGNIRFRTF